jgi:hypothetical protein
MPSLDAESAGESGLGSQAVVGNFLTRIVTIIALTCFLVAGAAVASILGRDSVPTLPPAQMTSLDIKSSALVPNREAKQDRLAAVSFATASLEPSQVTAALSELRHAYASSDPADLPTSAVAAPSAMAPNQQKPKLAVKPQPQKQYALLSDAQIAGIKEHLNLSPEQESYWPAVENALRAVARKIHATRQATTNAAGVPPIDPDAEEVQQLKSAAMPLLFQLREDQKNEVRKLARIIGLEKVAAQI